MRSELELLVDDAAHHEGDSANNLPQTGTDDDDIMDAYSRAVITAAEKISPSVVYIEIQQPISSRRGNAPQSPQKARGSGSAFTVTPAGFTLTNSHVAHH